MLFRYALAAIVLAWTPAAIADTIDTEINTSLPSGKVPPITASDLRTVLHDMNAAYPHRITGANSQYGTPIFITSAVLVDDLCIRRTGRHSRYFD